MRNILRSFSLLVLFSTSVAAQDQVKTGTITSTTCPGSGCVSLTIGGVSSSAIAVTGTFVATLQFEATVDGSTYFNINAFAVPAGTGVSLATAPGQWVFAAAGYRAVRVRASVYVSGTATVTLRASSGMSVAQVNVGVGGGGSGGGLTDTELRATPVPVSGTVTATGPLTDTQLRATPVPVSGTVTATGPLTDTQLRATPVPVSGTVTTSPPSNASTNVAQMGGTAVSMNTGTRDAGTQRVTIATNDSVPVTGTFWQATQPVSGTVTTTPPSNASTNVAQLAGTAPSVNSGTKDAGTLRVVLATDQPALTNKLLVTPDSVALPANQSVNVAQIAGNTTSTAATGVQKVGVTGNAGAAVDAANNAAMPANAVATGLQTATIDTTPTAATAGNLRYQLASTEGVTYVQEGGPKRFSCLVPSTTTATTQCQAAPAAGLRAYVTAVTLSNAVTTAQSIDLVFGTGTNCATGTTALTHKWFWIGATETGLLTATATYPTPLVPTAANAICFRPTAATAFGGTITGYIAP